MRSAVVFIGGDPPHPGIVARLPADAWVVAADSGLDHALALGISVDLLVGDLDSVSEQGLAAAEAAGIAVQRHPPDKDATDTELAIDAAVAFGCERLTVVSGIGDRLDHSLGALLAVARPSLDGIDVEAWWGEAHVAPMHGPTSRTFAGAPGDVVSLLPVHGAATGITTGGLRFPLHAETLEAGSSRGVSNEFTETTARIDLGGGCLLVVVPHALRRGTP